MGGRPPALDDPRTLVHYIGVAGTGMSALAVHRARGGGRAVGSDRALDQGLLEDVRRSLETAGVHVVPQDGKAVRNADIAVTSTAVEAAVPDLSAAREIGIPVLHRSELLASLLDPGPSLAVAGTSGKSTVAGMLFEILRACGHPASLVTGGPLVSLLGPRDLGNAWNEPGGTLVAEADESDGTLVRYHPGHALVLNIQKDHDEPEAIRRQAATFLSNVRQRAAVGDQPGLPDLDPDALVFGFSERADFRGTDLELAASGSRFRVGGVTVRVPLAGRHNAENALAALAGASLLGVPCESAAAALACFRGISRRFELIGERRGVRVVDDFAHNPVKIAAAIAAARLSARRVLAFWQPHGFAPMRFFRHDLARILAETLGPSDRLYLADILYLGGTVTRDVSSSDLAQDVAARGIRVTSGPRERLRDRIAADARPGDTVLVMGARDPTLGPFARSLLGALSDATAAP